MRRFPTITLLSVLIFIEPIYSQDKKATDQLNLTLKALGGKELIASIKTVKYTAKGHEFSIEQSDRPEGPYLVNYISIASTKDISAQKCLYTIQNENFPAPLNIIVDRERVAMSIRGKYFPGYQEMDEQLSLAIELIVPLALSSNPRYIKDTTYQRVQHAIVGFEWKKFPVRLFINNSTNLITCVEIVRPIKSGHAYIWGDVKRSFIYSFWTLEENGMHYPRQTDVFLNLYPLRTIRIDSIRFNTDTKSLDSLLINDQTADQMRKLKMMGMNPFEYPALKPPVEIAKGIYFIKGSWNSTFVKTAKGIVVLETPITSVYSKAVINEIKRTFPQEKIIAAISTSDAWPHTGGVREYVANRIPLYILDLNDRIVNDILKAKFTFQPDSLQKVKIKYDVRKVSSKTGLGEGDNRMEIYPIRTESGERMMMVYFPGHKLLYTSDLIQRNPGTGKFFMSQYLSEVKAAVLREGLVVENIFGIHIGMIPYSEIVNELKKYKE